MALSECNDQNDIHRTKQRSLHASLFDTKTFKLQLRILEDRIQKTHHTLVIFLLQDPYLHFFEDAMSVCMSQLVLFKKN